MRERFGVILRLNFYNESDLLSIIQRSAKLLKISIDIEGAKQIAKRSRGTPRIANRILKRSRDFAAIMGDGTINQIIAKKALSKLGIDETGLDEMDKKILLAIVDNFRGGPVGLESIGVAISENAKTIEEVYEPYLIKKGYIHANSKGKLKGKFLKFPKISVGATQHLLISSVLAKGMTILKNCAIEPEVKDLTNFLRVYLNLCLDLC